jgi:multidrug efflux pump subunit AcrA (membrane-fusion protein)
MTVEKGSFEIVIPAFGELQAVKSTPIMVPPQVRGRQTIAWMAPENSLVKKGDTVIRMDSTWYNERIQREEYAVSKLDLEIKKKQGQLGKEKNDLQGQLKVTGIEKAIAELYGAKDESIYSRNEIIDDAVNLEYLETRERHFERKKSQLEEKSRAELQLLQLKKKTHMTKIKQYRGALSSLEIKAPHAGLFIYEKNWRGEKPRLGQGVWSGTKLGKLPDLDQMEAKIYVLESEAAGLKQELPVSVELDSSPGIVFSGKVSNIDTIAKPLGREDESPLKYFEIKVSLEKTDRNIMKPGSQVKAVIYVQQQEDVISVPNQAIFFEDEKMFVNVESSSGVEARQVEIGVRSLTRTIIAKGLEEGEKIFLNKPAPEDE